MLFKILSKESFRGLVELLLASNEVVGPRCVGKKKTGVDAKATAKAAQDFIDRAMRCEEKTFKSVGYSVIHAFSLSPRPQHY